MKDRFQGLISGLLIGASLTATTAAAFSGVIQKEVHYNNIKMMVDDKEIYPTDANGGYIEPFIMDDVTYLPVRATASALGFDVEWNQDTKTVMIYRQSHSDTISYDVKNSYATPEFYPDTTIPTYTSVTGIQVETGYPETDGNGVMYAYDYTSSDDVSAYWDALSANGWQYASREVDDERYIQRVYFVKDTDTMMVVADLSLDKVFVVYLK